MKDNKKLKAGLGYAAWVCDYVIAALGGVFVAGRKVREDMMAPENITTWVPVFGTYKKHFVEHVKKHNDDKLSARAFAQYMKDADTYNPYAEINEKNLGDMVKKMKDAHCISVAYFEKTEHQRPTPMICKFGDYIIQFASDGTEWCGGMRGNGYISMVNYINKQIKSVASISPQLSDYLGKMVTQKTK